MAEPLEKDITNKILKALREKAGSRGWFKKIHGSPYMSSLPDIIGCFEGRFVGLEVKRPSNRGGVTPGQQAELDAIWAAGGIAAVVTSVDEALASLVYLEYRRQEATSTGQTPPHP